MFADDNDTEYLNEDERVFNERLERIGGVFVEPQHAEVDCNAEDNACAPDDYPEDPYAIDNRPGTVDDIGYGLGLQTREPADHSLMPDVKGREAGTAARGVERERELGEPDECDLWQEQEPLIEEDVEDGVRIPLGMDEKDAARVMAAMGDDSGDATPEGIEGNSATGEPTTTPDRGGFPERKG